MPNDHELKDEKQEVPAISLSPKGHTLPNAELRLNEIIGDAEQARDAEHIMMKLWAEENTRKAFLNLGLIPLDLILHTCNEKCGSAGKEFRMVGCSRHSYITELDEHDVKVAAATVQWLATNVGRGFLDRFFKMLSDAHKPKAGSLLERRIS